MWLVLPLLLAAAGNGKAEDWPEWRGKGRAGVWKETGILERFAAGGLRASWRRPIRAGIAGPAVAGGRVYVTDFEKAAGSGGVERLLCLDEETGNVLWRQEWKVDYRGISYGYGPRATPTVDGGRVYVVGASGVLHCLNSSSGAVLWKKEYSKDYGTQLPVWGIAGAPLIDGEKLIAIVGGRPDALVVAWDKTTGNELWRALAPGEDMGYAQPVLTEAAGVRQLIVWRPEAVFSLAPEHGKELWRQPMRVNLGMTVATPVLSGAKLLVSSFYNGSMLLEMAGAAAKMLWQGKSDSEINTDGLHAVVNTPVIDGEFIYGICSYGQFRCLKLRTGERVWETLAVTKEKARWASGFIVRQGERYFINNDRGELIIAKLSPRGFEEVSRTSFMKPTTEPGNRRELGAVNWSHPAYANRHVVARNDEEIVRYSLARE
ncbi:MAG: PQQ-like beta-propeller repeat protein [Bryobacteraceae bacterium]|nr:PQQ-like beta-propeller repeat protein [Bryobacteraceae bacterium]